MARSKNLADDMHCRGQNSDDRDDGHGWGDRDWNWSNDDSNLHGWHDSHPQHGSCDSGRDHNNGRIDIDLDLDKRHDGIDLEIDVETHGKWLDVDIEIGKLDFELKLDARHLTADDGPMGTLVMGEGTAIGVDTLVDADIFGRLLDLGHITVAFGTTTFKSAAVTGGDGAFAIADTFADVTGADLVFTFNSKTTIAGSYNGDSFAIETSTTNYIAIDFEDFDFAEGQLAFNFYEISSYLDAGNGNGGAKNVPHLDGNVATLDVDALAQADNTLVDVLSSVLTLEDQLSTVSAMVVTAGG
jgi:hypothetical protein